MKTSTGLKSTIQIELRFWYCSGIQVNRCQPNSLKSRLTLFCAKRLSEVDIC